MYVCGPCTRVHIQEKNLPQWYQTNRTLFKRKCSMLLQILKEKKFSLKFEAFKCVILKLSWIKYFRIGDVDSHFISKKICIIDWLRYIKCPISLSLAGWKQSCSGEYGKLPKQSSIGSKTATAKRRANWNCIRFNQ